MSIRNKNTFSILLSNIEHGDLLNSSKTDYVNNKTKKSRKTNKTNKTNKISDASTAESSKNNCFDFFDNMTLEKNIFDDNIFKYSDDEYFEALKFVCGKYNCLFDDWWSINEAIGIIYDKKLMTIGLKPRYSDTLREPIIVNLPKECVNISIPLFDHPIVLFREWKTMSKEWHSEIIALMRNPIDFWTVIKQLTNQKCGNSLFCSSISGKEVESESIFNDLIFKINSENNSGITKQNYIYSAINNYNCMHSIWSFIKVDKSFVISDKIEVPFIRDNKRAINSIDITLKDTKTNLSKGIHCVNPTFESGYIPEMIMDFICDLIPKEVTAITFNKTITGTNNIFFKGYRLQVLTNTIDQSQLLKCKEYIMNDFIDAHSVEECIYSKCIVRISLPKK
jgi:hypothetical protein